MAWNLSDDFAPGIGLPNGLKAFGRPGRARMGLRERFRVASARRLWIIRRDDYVPARQTG
jgi:hypothetical protein